MLAIAVRAIARFGVVVCCIVVIPACGRQGVLAGSDTEISARRQRPAQQELAGNGRSPDREGLSYANLLARGEYLVEGIAACGSCHATRDGNGRIIEGMELAGNFVIEEPGFSAYAPNITPDEETGIGTWFDEEIIRAVREGIRPDGSVMGPPMAYPFYRGTSDRDMEAIVAYLRNVPPIRNEVPDSTYDIPLPPDWDPPVDSVPETPRDDQVVYGRYLAHTLGHCTACHTPLVEGQYDFSRVGAGGTVFSGLFGLDWSVVVPNITQHPELGIGGWTDEEIKRAITQGISRDGRKLLPCMAFEFYKNISEEDLDAIVAYLRTLPPAVEEFPEDY